MLRFAGCTHAVVVLMLRFDQVTSASRCALTGSCLLDVTLDVTLGVVSRMSLFQINLRSHQFHPDEYSSCIRLPIGNWSPSFKNETNGSNALGWNRIHDEYSPGLNRSNCRWLSLAEASVSSSTTATLCGRKRGRLPLNHIPYSEL
jgi:hypothetical protein